MIYGEWLSSNKMAIAAADSIYELLDFHDAHDVIMTPSELLLDSAFEKFIFVPHIIEFADETNAEAYCREKQVVIVDRNELVAHQRRLIVEANTVGEDVSTIAREPTIAERLGLASAVDTIDRPSSIEQTVKKAVTQAPSGMTSDDSFKQTEGNGKLLISDIGLTKDANGKLRVGKMQAHQGVGSVSEHNAAIRAAEYLVREKGTLAKEWIMFAVTNESIPGEENDATIVMFVKKKRFIDRNNKAAICTPDPLTLPEEMVELSQGIYHYHDITPQDAVLKLIELGFHADSTIRDVFMRSALPTVGVALSSRLAREFYRFDVIGMSLVNLTDSWSAQEFDAVSQAAGYGEIDGNAWYAFAKQANAEIVLDRVKRKGHKVSALHVVNPLNERFIQASGVSLKPIKSEPPRPWNDLAAKLETMSPDDLQRNLESYQGIEFYFARINYTSGPNEIRVLIGPRSYFDLYKKPYPQSLNIAHLLPCYLREVSPGVYATCNADWPTVEFWLREQKGFGEQLSFSAYANRL